MSHLGDMWAVYEYVNTVLECRRVAFLVTLADACRCPCECCEVSSVRDKEQVKQVMQVKQVE